MTGWWWRSWAVAGVYGAAGWLGWSLSGTAAFVHAFWLALGVALAVLVRWGQGALPALFAGAVALQWATGAPPVLAFGLALGQVAVPWMAARCLLRAGFNPQLTRRRDLWLLLGVGGLCTAGTALYGASWLAATGRMAPSAWPLTVLQWWSGDTLGLLLAGVPLLTLGRRSLANAVAAQRRHFSLGLLAGAGALLAASFMTTAWLGLGALAWLLAMPVLLCALAMRAGLATASAAVLAMSMGLGAATAAGLGPFAQLDQLQPGSGQLLLWTAAGTLAALMLVAHALAGELVRLDERWQLALAGSDLGVADWNLRTGESFTSACWRRQMDDPLGAQGRSLAHWLDQVHADDRPALDAALAAHSTGHKPGAGLQRELRLRRGTGWHWFDLHLCVAERDAAGQPLRVVASLADVGDRRDAAARQQLSASVFMHLHEGLVVTDADLQVLDANPTYCRIVGIPREELIGQVPALLRPGLANGLHRPQQASLFAALRSQGHWVGEVVERRRNGEPCALHITVSTVHAPDGALRHHVLVVSDVTEQRQQRER